MPVHLNGSHGHPIQKHNSHNYPLSLNLHNFHALLISDFKIIKQNIKTIHIKHIPIQVLLT